MATRKNLRKYVDYIFDNGSFDAAQEFGELSDHVIEAYSSLRGTENPPALIIHGIMKRSGTVFVGQLLSLHPHICAHPNNIWEVPFLPLTADLVKIQKKFLYLYDRNQGRMGDNDFLPIFGGAFINYLYTYVPDGQRMLLKIPGVQYLNNFYSVFPGESLLVLLRDGRDVVSSTIRTWPQIQFSVACRRWDKSARMVLACDKLFSGNERYLLAKYEDAVHTPDDFVRTVCSRHGLDPTIFPFDRIPSIKVIGSSTSIRSGKTWVKKTQDFNPIGRWQHWSAWKKAIFKLIAGKSLVQLEYATNLQW